MSPDALPDQSSGQPAVGSLEALLTQALALGEHISGAAEASLAALRELEGRLAQERLQLAVLGQFKRGKSTLLNALVGCEVLPMGLLPVTAITTFLEGAATPGLVERYLDDRETQARLDDLGQLEGWLAVLVTEEANPKNRLGLSQVTVRIPSALLQEGLVLIDTPGVGSTFQHNSEAAVAALPACDAALFVVSPDPPITELEVQYLARIKPHVARVFVVLNKIDLVDDPADAARAEAFLGRTLIDHCGLEEPEIFPVSARAALQAKKSGDMQGVERSGLGALERRLVALLQHEKGAVLQSAIARKARARVADLGFQGELELKALRLPLSELARRQQVFEAAMRGLQDERRTVADLFAADLKRALQVLDDEAVRLRGRIRVELEEALDLKIAEGADPGQAWRELQVALPDRFETELNLAIGQLRGQLDPMFHAHQARADRLIDLVRRTAAEIMEVPLSAAPETEGFEAISLPYWVVERPDALNPLPAGAFDRLLPRQARERHARAKACGEIADLTTRNVENLRWAMRQNVQDAFRRIGSEFDARIAASLAATRGVMATASTRRSGYAETVEAELEELQDVIERLHEVESALQALVVSTQAGGLA